MFKILDCTLRDGGYYNNWDFDLELVNSYLQLMSKLKIDLVEIGFRTLSSKKYLGPLDYCSSKYLGELKIPLNLKKKIGVMINASEFSKFNSIKQVENCLEKLFPKEDNKIISFVRIACHDHEIVNFFKLCKWFKKKKIKVFFNLMQISEISKVRIIEIMKKSKNFEFEGFYIADSLGSLHPSEIVDIINLIKREAPVKIGLHAHNNKLMALANSLEAARVGATYLDSTIKGMGRGCGNTQTEYLYVERHKKDKLFLKNHAIVDLVSLIEKSFDKLNQEYKWSDNLYYYLSGEFKIHPSYVQEIQKNQNYSESDILNILSTLANNHGQKYNIENISKFQNALSYNQSTDFIKAKKIFKNKDILILGSGKNLEKIKPFLHTVIKEKKMIVLSINKSLLSLSNIKQFTIVSHPTKIISHQKKKQTSFKEKTISPMPKINNNYLFYGMKISNEKIKFLNNYCFIPKPLGLFYAIAVANAGKCKSITLAGIDGYKDGDERNFDIDNFFKNYEKNNFVPIKSITETKYKIPTISLFSPNYE